MIAGVPDSHRSGGEFAPYAGKAGKGAENAGVDGTRFQEVDGERRALGVLGQRLEELLSIAQVEFAFQAEVRVRAIGRDDAADAIANGRMVASRSSLRLPGGNGM